MTSEQKLAQLAKAFDLYMRLNRVQLVPWQTDLTKAILKWLSEYDWGTVQPTIVSGNLHKQTSRDIIMFPGHDAGRTFLFNHIEKFFNDLPNILGSSSLPKV